MIASCFNEPNNEIVWSESLSLARDMLNYWVKKPSISSSADDLRTLSLHVLAGIGFGKSFEFEGHDERKNTSLSGDYKTLRMYIFYASLFCNSRNLRSVHFTPLHSLLVLMYTEMILENCILIMVLGPRPYPWPGLGSPSPGNSEDVPTSSAT